MSGKKRTHQLDIWKSGFGEAYTDRNEVSAEEMDCAYERERGVRKSVIFKDFLPPDLERGAKILEVGSNVGAQLRILQKLRPDFEFHGVEPMAYALKKAEEASPDMHFTKASAFDLPFEDGRFDLVMTNCVLIHISPTDLARATSEIYRCSKRYIFLQEFFAETETEVRYRGHKGLLWKTDFMARYLEQFPDLVLVKVDYIKYPGSTTEAPMIDQVCLLKKPGN